TAARTWQVSDVCGNTSTCTQTVTVVDHGPPVVVAQPQSKVVPVGQAISLSVGISACPPLSYQWYFNATNPLTAGTNATLELSNVTLADAGEYLVVVSNTYGSVTSAPAQL